MSSCRKWKGASSRAISFKADAVADPLFEHAETRHEPAADRVAYVAKLAAAWGLLSRKPRGERKIAIVLSDYPARGGRSGYAVQLDSFESVREILSLLRQEGYDAGPENAAASTLAADLSGNRDFIEVSLGDYRDFLGSLPDILQKTLAETWGAPESDPSFWMGASAFPA